MATIHPLSIEAAAATGATHLAVITKADLTDADASQVIPIATVKAGTLVQCIHAFLAETFVSSDATNVSLAVQVGDGGSAARFLASYEILASPVTAKGGVSTS